MLSYRFKSVDTLFSQRPRTYMPTTPSYLFLDFDGVLHPHTRGTFCRGLLLESWLRAHPSVQIVISSDWRLDTELAGLRACFADTSLHTRVVGVTPSFGPSAGSRQAEIEAWMAEHAPTAPFAALDDSPELFKASASFLVRTHAAEGLTEADLASVSQLLGLPCV